MNTFIASLLHRNTLKLPPTTRGTIIRLGFNAPPKLREKGLPLVHQIKPLITVPPYDVIPSDKPADNSIDTVSTMKLLVIKLYHLLNLDLLSDSQWSPSTSHRSPRHICIKKIIPHCKHRAYNEQCTPTVCRYNTIKLFTGHQLSFYSVAGLAVNRLASASMPRGPERVGSVIAWKGLFLAASQDAIVNSHGASSGEPLKSMTHHRD